MSGAPIRRPVIIVHMHVLPTSVTVSVSDIVTVAIGHRLGKVEAVRRLKEGFARTNGQLGGMIAMEQETWQGDTVRFRMRALGQTASATIEVLEDALRIEVSLPWLLAQAAKRLLPILRTKATRLLEPRYVRFGCCSGHRSEQTEPGASYDRKPDPLRATHCISSLLKFYESAANSMNMQFA